MSSKGDGYMKDKKFIPPSPPPSALTLTPTHRGIPPPSLFPNDPPPTQSQSPTPTPTPTPSQTPYAPISLKPAPTLVENIPTPESEPSLFKLPKRKLTTDALEFSSKKRKGGNKNKNTKPNLPERPPKHKLSTFFAKPKLELTSSPGPKSISTASLIPANLEADDTFALLSQVDSRAQGMTKAVRFSKWAI